jgi:hypothetical protein
MRTFRGLAALGAVIAGSLVVAAPTASADGPSITVTPSTDVVDGQTVTVAGTGFTVGTPTLLLLDECANVASPLVGDCATSGLQVSITDTDDFVGTYTATRLISTANEGSLDCAVANTCIVEAAVGFVGYQIATAPITFSTVVPTFRILNARLVHRVSPGEPVELGVRAVNDGQSPANWSISQSNDVGLIPVRAICPGGSARGPGSCLYTPAERGVGQPVTAVFTMKAAPGFVGTASATICATDLDLPGSAPQSNMCEVVTTTVG